MDFVTKAGPLHEINLDLHEGTLSGFPAIFGNWDLDGEMVQKGAFTKSIAERMRRIPMGLDHEHPLGITTLLQEVGRSDLPKAIQKAYPDADGGLYAEGQIVQMGYAYDWMEAEVSRQRRGRPSGMSFTGKAPQVKKAKGPGGRDGLVYVEINVKEWGPSEVLTPRNKAAGVLAVKAGMAPDELAALADEIDLPDLLQVAGQMAAYKAGKALNPANSRALQAAITELQQILAAATGTDAGAPKGDEPPTATAKAAPALIRISEAELSLTRLRTQLLGVTA